LVWLIGTVYSGLAEAVSVWAALCILRVRAVANLGLFLHLAAVARQSKHPGNSVGVDRFVIVWFATLYLKISLIQKGDRQYQISLLLLLL